MTRLPTVINWDVSGFFGWGVYGLNLALNWARDPQIQPIGARPMDNLGAGPLKTRALARFLADSADFQAKLAPYAERKVTVPTPVLGYYDAHFKPRPAAHRAELYGTPQICVTFFETAQLERDAVARALAFETIVTGSAWNTQVLEAHGHRGVRRVLQGIDPTLFFPGPASGDLADRFCVFSGGKLELRKGQDLVLAAFRIFAVRHPDALLVTAWHCPWPHLAQSLSASGRVGPVPFDAQGRPAVVQWAQENGVAADQVIDLGRIANVTTAQVLREMDVALFPNRGEGGTNLVAMECMACGVPTILSANTGHLDLIEGDNCIPLVRQGAVAGEGAPFGDVAGWGESDVDEIVEALERAYADRAAARAVGRRGAQTLSKLTWAETAAQMKGLVLELTGAP